MAFSPGSSPGSARQQGGNMKSFTYMIGMTFTAVTILASCGTKKYSMSGPYKAIVLAFTGKNASDKAEFALTEKSFRTLTDFNELDGTFVSIRRGGTLTIREVNGSLVSSEGFSGGKSPDLRYRVDSGVAVPLDYSTLAMLSAYYQLDEIYSTLEEKVGIAPNDLQSLIPGGKHTMLFEPEIKISGKGSDLSAGLKLNAAFSPADKKFLLYQRSPVESVPLAANLQVLSHEFGHFIFDASFFAGKSDSENRWYNEWTMSGVNEGFADFISWAFTDISDVLRASIDIESKANERDFVKTSFVFSDLNFEEPSACKGEFYCVGSLFARSLYQTWLAMQATVTKKDLATGVVETLKKCQEAMNNMDVTVLPGRIDRDSVSFSERYAHDGKVAGAFLRAFALNAPQAWKKELCSAFTKNFGTAGFPEAARTGACD